MEQTKQPKLAKPFNPFYVLLLIVGTVFAITACAYGVMTVQMLRNGQMSLAMPEPPAEIRSEENLVNASTAADIPASGVHLLEFLDKHGFQLMMWQLGVLAIVTVAAIGTDEFWSHRASQATKAASKAASKASRQSTGPHPMDS